MSEVKLGWHMPSFPVDGSGADAFLRQCEAALDLIQGRMGSVWVDDHFWPWGNWQAPDTPYTEIVSTMAFYAARYPQLYWVSSMFCQSYRSPGVIAKTVANLQWLTGGRIIFGFGAGWMEEEYRAFAYDFPSPAVRIAQMEEAIQIIKKLWTESPASFAGKYYRIKNAYCSPKPNPIPPLMIGGGGEQLTLRAVAKYADWWNQPGGTLENYARKIEILRRHCAALGRNYDDIVKTYNAETVAIAPTEAAAKRIAAASPYQNAPIIGTPQQVAEQLHAFAELGVQHIALRLVDFPQMGGLELLLDQVIPLLEA
jgi:alkanesulfonate monooxygenase SsuD/methylene tetrahydromethanopterin reductase-like flavin-dependent oxidoreductase (luciferase family)